MAAISTLFKSSGFCSHFFGTCCRLALDPWLSLFSNLLPKQGSLHNRFSQARSLVSSQRGGKPLLSLDWKLIFCLSLSPDLYYDGTLEGGNLSLLSPRFWCSHQPRWRVSRAVPYCLPTCKETLWCWGLNWGPLYAKEAISPSISSLGKWFYCFTQKCVVSWKCAINAADSAHKVAVLYVLIHLRQTYSTACMPTWKGWLESK